MAKDYYSTVNEGIVFCQDLCKKNKFEEALDVLLSLEKQTRTGLDPHSCGRVLVAIVRLCYETQSYKLLNDLIVSLSEKEGQTEQALSKMVQECTRMVKHMKNEKEKLILNRTIRKVTDKNLVSIVDVKPNVNPYQTWICPSCQNINSLRRERCNFCSKSKQDKEGHTKTKERSDSVNEPGTSDPKTGETKFKDQELYIACDDRNIVPNVEEFICTICMCTILSGDGTVLHDCLHTFCKECLAGVIQHSESPLVRCPFQNDDYACGSHLQEREVKSLVSPQIYEKHLQRSMVLAESQAPNSFHCKTTDCPGWCLYEDDVNHFVCPMCNKSNCLTCAAIHEGKNCKEYQDYVALNCDIDEEAKRTKKYLQSMLEKGEAMECPKCQITIMKKNGCDALTCSMCHTEICWVTKGARWGPKGKGDYSGGCRCNYNGQRCHPKCRNCH